MNTSEYLEQSRLPSSVLRKHYHDIRGVECATLNVDLKISERLHHVRIAVVQLLESLLLCYLFSGKLMFVSLHVLLGRDAVIQVVLTETHLIRRNVTSQEDIDTLTDGER